MLWKPLTLLQSLERELLGISRIQSAPSANSTCTVERAQLRVCDNFNNSGITRKDESIWRSHITNVIPKKDSAVTSAVAKLTQNSHKAFKKLSCFIHRRQKVLRGTIKNSTVRHSFERGMHPLKTPYKWNVTLQNKNSLWIIPKAGFHFLQVRTDLEVESWQVPLKEN